MLKIQRSVDDSVVFRLSGRIEMEDVGELRRLFALESADHHIVLDLEDVTLVDRDAVSFLSDCETGGIRLINCSAYLRQWLGRCRSPQQERPV